MAKTKRTERAARKYALIGWVLLGALIAVAWALGQDSTWIIDSQHSTARLLLDSSINPEAGVNVGVARASGVIVRRAGNSAPSDFDFTIHLPDKAASRERSAQEQGGESPVDNPNYTVVRFRSKRVVPLSAASFRVTGDLTLTYVERLAANGQGDADSGAAYRPAVTESVTQPAEFEFHQVPSPRLTQDDDAEWFASGTMNGEDFPELLNAVSDLNGPTFVLNEKCDMPSNQGQGFPGDACTGTGITVGSGGDVHREMPSVDADFAGEMCAETLPAATTHVAAQGTEAGHHGGREQTRLAANQVRMRLDLRLARMDSPASVGSGQE